MKIVSIKFIVILFILTSCTAQEVTVENNNNPDTTNLIHDDVNDEVIAFNKAFIDNNFSSKAIGSVSNGQLENGKLVDYYGSNFTYFDKDSYLGSRAYTMDIVWKTIKGAYTEMEILFPDKHFYLMELSNENGGKIAPHRTHQNGLSVDFMMPMLKNGETYTGLDTLGKNHYWLGFDDNGVYDKDTSITVDFNTIAKHILLLNEEAKKNGLKITKVIIKIAYKDNLFASEYGQELKDSGIYIVRNLSPLIDSIHDDHYHIDFEEI